MSKVNYHVLNESIVLNFEGRTEVISVSDKRYGKILDKIREGKLEDIPAMVEEVEKAFEGTGLELKEGRLYDGETALPDALTSRIIKFQEMALPYGPLLSFWKNLKLNPSFNSRHMLYKFLEHNGHPLTDDGHFIAYRGVSEDFKDKHTGQFDNSPGKVLEMSRSEVDDNPKNTCSNGFHVACFSYARGFGEKLVEVKVNPADVVAVPEDYNGTKMRVCRFEVVQECSEVRKEEVYNNPDSVYQEEEPEDLDADDEGDDSDTTCSECDEDRDPFANFCSNCGYEYRT